MKRKVHIRDAGGIAIYNRLEDTGENAIPFAGGYGGFVTRDDCKRLGWTVCNGWIVAEDFGGGTATRIANAGGDYRIEED